MGGVGFHMDQIDFVLTGAEAVVANGGIINRVQIIFKIQLLLTKYHYYLYYL